MRYHGKKRLAEKSKLKFDLVASDIQRMIEYYNSLFIVHITAPDKFDNNKPNNNKSRIKGEIERVKCWIDRQKEKHLINN